MKWISLMTDFSLSLFFRAPRRRVLAANEPTRPSLTPGSVWIGWETAIPLPSNERVCAKAMRDIIALAF